MIVINEAIKALGLQSDLKTNAYKSKKLTTEKAYTILYIRAFILYTCNASAQSGSITTIGTYSWMSNIRKMTIKAYMDNDDFF